MVNVWIIPRGAPHPAISIGGGGNDAHEKRGGGATPSTTSATSCPPPYLWPRSNDPRGRLPTVFVRKPNRNRPPTPGQNFPRLGQGRDCETNPLQARLSRPMAQGGGGAWRAAFAAKAIKVLPSVQTIFAESTMLIGMAPKIMASIVASPLCKVGM